MFLRDESDWVCTIVHQPGTPNSNSCRNILVQRLHIIVDGITSLYQAPSTRITLLRDMQPHLDHRILFFCADQLVLHPNIRSEFQTNQLSTRHASKLSIGDHECQWHWHDLEWSSCLYQHTFFFKSVVVTGCQALDATRRLANNQQIVTQQMTSC